MLFVFEKILGNQNTCTIRPTVLYWKKELDSVLRYNIISGQMLGVFAFGGRYTLSDHEYHNHGMIFKWNEYKAETNERKHGVTFEEAATVFKDVNARFYGDDEHSGDENHFILLGYSVITRLLVVCHCYRGEDDSVIRIISARKATQQERQRYEERE
jgi:uncharacterized DUF497 family protein